MQGMVRCMLPCTAIDLASYMGHEGGGKENHFFYSTHLSIFAYRKRSKTEARKVLGMKRPPCRLNTRLDIPFRLVYGLKKINTEFETVPIKFPLAKAMFIQSVQSAFLYCTLVPRLLYTAWGATWQWGWEWV